MNRMIAKCIRKIIIFSYVVSYAVFFGQVIIKLREEDEYDAYNCFFFNSFFQLTYKELDCLPKHLCRGNIMWGSTDMPIVRIKRRICVEVLSIGGRTSPLTICKPRRILVLRITQLYKIDKIDKEGSTTFK